MSVLEVTLNLKMLHSSAEDACRLMKVLSNRDRMMLLCQISQGEMCVSELEECLDIHQSTLSQQLTVALYTEWHSPNSVDKYYCQMDFPRCSRQLGSMISS